MPAAPVEEKKATQRFAPEGMLSWGRHLEGQREHHLDCHPSTRRRRPRPPSGRRAERLNCPSTGRPTGQSSTSSFALLGGGVHLLHDPTPPPPPTTRTRPPASSRPTSTLGPPTRTTTGRASTASGPTHPATRRRATGAANGRDRGTGGTLRGETIEGTPTAARTWTGRRGRRQHGGGTSWRRWRAGGGGGRGRAPPRTTGGTARSRRGVAARRGNPFGTGAPPEPTRIERFGGEGPGAGRGAGTSTT